MIVVTYVVIATINAAHACRPVVAGFVKLPIISFIASKMKITDIREEKMSSVNRVKVSTMFEVENTDERNNIRLDQRPIQLYTGKNGTPFATQASYTTFRNANRGPVVPIIVNG